MEAYNVEHFLVDDLRAIKNEYEVVEERIKKTESEMEKFPIDGFDRGYWLKRLRSWLSLILRNKKHIDNALDDNQLIGCISPWGGMTTRRNGDSPYRTCPQAIKSHLEMIRCWSERLRSWLSLILRNKKHINNALDDNQLIGYVSPWGGMTTRRNGDSPYRTCPPEIKSTLEMMKEELSNLNKDHLYKFIHSTNEKCNKFCNIVDQFTNIQWNTVLSGVKKFTWEKFIWLLGILMTCLCSGILNIFIP